MSGEYLRRNLLHASSVGVVANTKTTLVRVSAAKRQPKWLKDALQGILDRATPLPKALAAYRNAAPDAPKKEPRR